jgi:hypothetical protein
MIGDGGFTPALAGIRAGVAAPASGYPGASAPAC